MRARALGVVRGPLALLALAVLLALAACSGPAPSPAPTGLPAGVAVSFVQLRSDVASRQAEVRVTNGGGRAIAVGRIAVDDPRFDGAAERMVDKTSTVPSGASTDIRVQLPPSACPGPDRADADVTLHLEVDGAQRVVTAPLPDPLSFVPPLHERECRAHALAAAADVSFTAFVPSDAGAPADLELTVAPTGAGAAELTGIRETNLLSFDLPGGVGGQWPIHAVAREGDRTPVVVHLPLVPARCDPHAVLEDKRGTVFRIEAVIDGREGQIELAADEEMRGRILTWVTRWCGYGSP